MWSHPASASAGADYKRADGTVTFAAGSVNNATQTIPIQIMADALDEADETFAVNLSTVMGGSMSGTASEVFTITDDDAAPTMSIGDASVTEGHSGSVDLVLTVSLSAPSGRTVTVQSSISAGTATASGDFTITSGTLSFDPGSVRDDRPRASDWRSLGRGQTRTSSYSWRPRRTRRSPMPRHAA